MELLLFNLDFLVEIGKLEDSKIQWQLEYLNINICS